MCGGSAASEVLYHAMCLNQVLTYICEAFFHCVAGHSHVMYTVGKWRVRWAWVGQRAELAGWMGGWLRRDK